MKINIENLGPIKDGTIDLDKKLIVLTGPNNTGKSYLTYLIHAVTQYQELGSTQVIHSELTEILGDKGLINQLITEEQPFYLPTHIKSKALELSKYISNVVELNFSKVFASQLVKPSISIQFLDYTDEHFITRTFPTIKVSAGKLEAITGTGIVAKDAFYSKTFLRYDNIEDLAKRAIFVTFSVATEEEIIENTYFFPAERTAINLFAKHITAIKAEIKDELDIEVIAGMSDDELGKRLRAQVKSAPKYPYAIREYINFVNNFKPSEKFGPFAPIADRLEIALIGGKVRVDKFDQLMFTPDNSEVPLELHLSSSLVKSLSYLILYLRYTAKQNHQIIIDEPELNLHPNLQVAIAKVIAEMVNAGLKVIISTHSDYLIKELNNLILLRKLPTSEENTAFMAEHGYRTEHLLDSNEVGAYFLNNQKIMPIDVVADGLEVPSINDVITSIDSVAQELFFRLEE